MTQRDVTQVNTGAPDRLRDADVEPCDEYDEDGGDIGPDGHPYCDCGWARDMHDAFLREGQL